jgi:hypothetical protein
VATGGLGERKVKEKRCGSVGECDGKVKPMRVATYICRLTDEYRRVVLVCPAPHIFVGDAISSTNIVHVYSMVTWHHRRI